MSRPESSNGYSSAGPTAPAPLRVVSAGWADLGMGASPSAATDVPQTRLKAWRVFHAAEYVRDVLPLVEGQLAVGMKPFIVTPQGCGSGESYLHGQQQESRKPATLLRAWQDVRNWRKSLLDCDPQGTAEIVHAHSFPAGMAAVRSVAAVVYDLTGFVEELHGDHAGSWMIRSFRVAEQFVLARAGAVVVHSQAMREAAQFRGAEREHLFLIPEPIDVNELELTPDREWMQSVLPGAEAGCVIFPADVTAECDGDRVQPAVEHLLRAFAQARREAPAAQLLLAVRDGAEEAVRGVIALLGLTEFAVTVPDADRQRAFAAADAVICSGGEDQVALMAMANGKAVLAADNAVNREVSPDGRGLLWFRPEDAGDLAYRAAFLATHADFRQALGQAGQSHLLQARSMAAIGQRYNEVYEHAFARRKSGNASGGFPQLQPLQACL